MEGRRLGAHVRISKLGSGGMGACSGCESESGTLDRGGSKLHPQPRVLRTPTAIVHRRACCQVTQHTSGGSRVGW